VICAVSLTRRRSHASFQKRSDHSFSSQSCTTGSVLTQHGKERMECKLNKHTACTNSLVAREAKVLKDICNGSAGESDLFV